MMLFKIFVFYISPVIWSWEVGRFEIEKEVLMKNWQEKDEARSNMLLQRVYASPHHYYWEADQDIFLGGN